MKYENVLEHSGLIVMTFAGQSQVLTSGLNMRKPHDNLTGGDSWLKHL